MRPSTPCCFLEEHHRADHVGADERHRVGDRSIDVALCSEVHHPIDVVGLEDGADGIPICDVALDEGVPGMVSTSARFSR